MNICILSIATLSHQMGGTEVHCRVLSTMASAMGHAVTIITTRHPRGLELTKENGCDVYYLSKTRPARLSDSWWKESADKIAQLHAQCPFDVIWAEHLSNYYYSWKIKPLLKIPAIAIMQVMGVREHLRSEFNRISSLKELLEFSMKYLPEAFLFYRPWFARTIRYSDAIIGISAQTLEALKREFRGSEKKLFLVYDGIDTDLFFPNNPAGVDVRKKFDISHEDKVILMAGVVHKQKGMHYGLRAFAEIKKSIPAAKLMIAGDGPHLPELKSLAHRMGIEGDVFFCGLIPNEEMYSYYNAADLFLNPTLRFEGLAIVNLEAMSCAKPVVTSCIGGTRSTIDDAVSGFFVMPKNVHAAAQKSIEILRDPGMARKMGECGRKKALREFSNQKMIDEYLRISQKLFQGG